MINDHDRGILEEIFSCLPYGEDSDCMSWQPWIYGKSNFKPFSLQFNQCRNDGTLFLENCNFCGHKILMCNRYGGQCISSKCKKDRIRPGGKDQCTLF